MFKKSIAILLALIPAFVGMGTTLFLVYRFVWFDIPVSSGRFIVSLLFGIVLAMMSVPLTLFALTINEK